MTTFQMVLLLMGPIGTIVAVVVGIVVNDLQVGRIERQISRASNLRTHMDDMYRHVDRRFDEMRDMVREDLGGFGERIEARLKRLGEG
jgi:hypothetical protein